MAVEHENCYEEINPAGQDRISVRKNDCYDEVKKLKSFIFKSPEDKSSSKKIVAVLIILYITFFILLGAVAASTGYALLEISKLRTEMASPDNCSAHIISQVYLTLNSKIDAMDAMLQQLQSYANVTQKLDEKINLTTEQCENATLQHRDQIMQLQASSNHQYSTLNSRVFQVQNFSNQQSTSLSSRIDQVETSSSQQYSTLNSVINQVQSSSETATQQTTAAITVLKQQSAQNDSILGDSIAIIENQIRELNNNVSRCGGLGWRRVGYLNMTNSSQSCPTGLALKTYSPGLRSCGRTTNYTGCWSTFYNTGTSQYSRVCGRVRGYQFGGTGAFDSPSSTINDTYVTGVSLTHGSGDDRTHIWTFASGLAEVDGDSFSEEHCPCVTASARLPPSFVGNDYFCESGLNAPWVREQWIFYPNDPLWDGENCVSSCCEFNNPPYFIKTLPAPTRNQIELRICDRANNGNSDTPIDQLELYVQ